MQRNSRVEQRDYNQLWSPKGNKFVIGTLHGKPIEITAQYNPKELARQATATWNTHANSRAKHNETSQHQQWLEYGTSEPRTLTLELLFDGYEEGISVAPLVEKLERLTLPVDMYSRNETERRPQLCVAVWGNQQLRCVVTSVATKLTMFDGSGEPLRATCNISLKEADVAAMMNKGSRDTAFTDRQTQLQGLSGAEKHTRRRHYVDEVAAPAPASSASSSARPAPAPRPASARPAPAPAAPAPAPAVDDAPLAAATPDDQLEPETDEAPAPAPAPATVGTPSHAFNPDTDLDSPPQQGTPSHAFNPDTDLDSPPATAPDAVSSADGKAKPTPADTKAVYDDLE